MSAYSTVWNQQLKSGKKEKVKSKRTDKLRSTGEPSGESVDDGVSPEVLSKLLTEELIYSYSKNRVR